MVLLKDMTGPPLEHSEAVDLCTDEPKKHDSIHNEAQFWSAGGHRWHFQASLFSKEAKKCGLQIFLGRFEGAPFAFVTHPSVLFRIRQHVCVMPLHTISKRLTCYWQGHVLERVHIWMWSIFMIALLLDWPMGLFSYSKIFILMFFRTPQWSV